MKRKYITYHVLMACLSHKRIPVRDIHAQLAETIAERKKILLRFEEVVRLRPSRPKKDIHAQLAETLAERKRIMERLHRVISAQKNDRLLIPSQKAA